MSGSTHCYLPEQGKIYIGWIEPGDGAMLSAFIEEAAAKFDGEIEVYINSGGGKIGESFQVADTIRNLDREVITIGQGLVCSMAVLMLASGDKRYAAPTTTFMTHEYSMSHDTLVSIIEARQNDLATRQQYYAEFMAQRTGKSTAFWVEKMQPVDHWFDAQQALEYGLIHEIRTPKKG